jgi:hypothetical protein
VYIFLRQVYNITYYGMMIPYYSEDLAIPEKYQYPSFLCKREFKNFQIANPALSEVDRCRKMGDNVVK